MAKKISGEVSTTLAGTTHTLRLEIDTILELEDHFDLGIGLLVAERLLRLRTADVTVVFLALTGQDFADSDLIKATNVQVLQEGVGTVAKACAECITQGLEALRAMPGKPKT